MDEELIKLLESDASEDVIREYISGGKRMGAKYMQRFGSPGHYRYIYAPKSAMKLSRKAQFYYSRFLKRAGRFLKKISTAYDAKSINVKPVTWRTAIVNVQKNSGLNATLYVDLKSHSIYSYRSHRGQAGASFKLSKAKKKGILRFR